MGMLCRATIPSTGATTMWGTTLLMASILSGVVCEDHICNPHGNRQCHFEKKCKKATKKDVVRAFVVLQARQGIFRGAAMMCVGDIPRGVNRPGI